MKNIPTRTRTALLTLSVVATVFAGGFATTFLKQQQLRQEAFVLRNSLENERVNVQDMQDLLVKKEEQIEVHKELLRALRQQSENTINDFSQIRQMVQNATQTIEDIKKLEEADEELLAKYSKVYFLNEHYVPDNLAFIPSEFVTSDKFLQIKANVLPTLTKMLSDMQENDLKPRVLSSYRAFDYQGELKNNHAVTYGTTEANKFIADQGYSEHQLGTTVDITTVDIGSDLSKFNTTPEYTWLLANAHRYGFVLSYPEDNAYYEFEPWHWRFVGVALATNLHEEGKYFYNVAQREINSYRTQMFE